MEWLERDDHFEIGMRVIFTQCACMLSHFSHAQFCGTLWTVACQAPLSMGFSRQEYMPSSRGSLGPTDRTWDSCIAGRFFNIWATKESPFTPWKSANKATDESYSPSSDVDCQTFPCKPWDWTLVVQWPRLCFPRNGLGSFCNSFTDAHSTGQFWVRMVSACSSGPQMSRDSFPGCSMGKGSLALSLEKDITFFLGRRCPLVYRGPRYSSVSLEPTNGSRRISRAGLDAGSAPHLCSAARHSQELQTTRSIRD